MVQVVYFLDQILGVNFFVKKGFSFEETIRKEVVNQNERHTKSTKDFEGHFWSKKYTTWTKILEAIFPLALAVEGSFFHACQLGSLPEGKP